MAKTINPKGKARESAGRDLDTEDRKIKTCPKCGVKGQIGPKFGWRKMGEVLRPQSWCLACRGVKEPTVRLTLDKEKTAKLFAETFPDNKQSYGWKTMAQRLVKKLPGLIISPEADAELNGDDLI